MWDNVQILLSLKCLYFICENGFGTTAGWLMRRMAVAQAEETVDWIGPWLPKLSLMQCSACVCVLDKERSD